MHQLAWCHPLAAKYVARFPTTDVNQTQSALESMRLRSPTMSLTVVALHLLNTKDTTPARLRYLESIQHTLLLAYKCLQTRCLGSHYLAQRAPQEPVHRPASSEDALCELVETGLGQYETTAREWGWGQASNLLFVDQVRGPFASTLDIPDDMASQAD